MLKSLTKKFMVGFVIVGMIFSSFPLIGANIKGEELPVADNEVISEVAEEIPTDNNFPEEVPPPAEELKVEENKGPEGVNPESLVEAKASPRGVISNLTIPTDGKLIIKDGGNYDLVDNLGNVTPGTDTIGDTTFITGVNSTILLENTAEVTAYYINVTGNLVVKGTGKLTSKSGITVSGELHLESGNLTSIRTTYGPYDYTIYANSIKISSGTLNAIGGGMSIKTDNDIIVSGQNAVINATLVGNDIRHGISATGNVLVENGGIIKIDALEPSLSSDPRLASAMTFSKNLTVKNGSKLLIGLDNPRGLSGALTGNLSGDNNIYISGNSTEVNLKCLGDVTRGIEADKLVIEDNATLTMESGYEGLMLRKDLQALSGAKINVTNHGHHAININRDYSSNPADASPVIIDNATVIGHDTGSTGLQGSFAILNRAGDMIVRNGSQVEGYIGNDINKSNNDATPVWVHRGSLIVDNSTVIGDVSRLVPYNDEILDGVYAQSIDVSNGGVVKGIGDHTGIRTFELSATEDSEVIGLGNHSGITIHDDGMTVDGTASITGTGNIYGINVRNSDLTIKGNGQVKGTGANDVVGAGVKSKNIISEGGHLVGISGMETQMGVSVEDAITISNKGVVEGFTPSFDDDGTGNTYSAVKADGTIDVSGAGKVIENYECCDDFTDSFFKACIKNINMSNYNNYTWTVGDGILDVDSSAGIRALTNSPDTTTLVASRTDGTGEVIQLSGNSTHLVNYNATLRGLYYQLKFDVNGGDINTTPETQLILEGEKGTEPAIPTRSGYTFLGWSQTANSSNYWNFETNIMPAENITLYAQWVLGDNGTNDGSSKTSSNNSKSGLPKTGGQMLVLGALALTGIGVLLLKKRKSNSK